MGRIFPVVAVLAFVCIVVAFFYGSSHYEKVTASSSAELSGIGEEELLSKVLPDSASMIDASVNVYRVRVLASFVVDANRFSQWSADVCTIGDDNGDCLFHDLEGSVLNACDLGMIVFEMKNPPSRFSQVKVAYDKQHNRCLLNAF